MSPTHTSAKSLRILQTEKTLLQDYDPLLIIECSSNLKADKCDRDYEDQTFEMIVETNDEGVVRDLIKYDKDKWLSVGTKIGIIDDGEPIDGDWTWQAYIHDNDEQDDSTKK